MEQATKTKRQVRRVVAGSAMNAMALSIWEGQSSDLPLNERVKRIVSGLKAQGHDDMSGLDLPAEGFGKYL